MGSPVAKDDGKLVHREAPVSDGHCRWFRRGLQSGDFFGE